MVFSSITFLFVFLPVTLVVYGLLRGRARNIWLLVASLVFYGFGEPKYIILLVISMLVNYFMGVALGRTGNDPQRRRRLCLVLGIIINLGMLGIFKYLDFVIGIISPIAKSITGSALSPVGLLLPIGISFFTFQGLSYVIDVYRGDVKYERNLLDFCMYISMFPQLIAGPIVRYSDVAPQIRTREVTPGLRAEGMERFIIGLGKKVLIANTCADIVQTLSTPENPGAVLAWFSALAYMFQIYFDFSAYSDMAIGIGKILGFHFPENFDHPYESTSITGFWGRWHMTLSSFFKEYVYIPLGGNRKGAGRQVINMLIVWALTGLWHGAGFNFLAWGIYYFIFLVLEKFVLMKLFIRLKGKISSEHDNPQSKGSSKIYFIVNDKNKNTFVVCYKLLGIIPHIYTLFVVCIGWVLFSKEGAGDIFSTLGAMFGAGGAVVSSTAFYTGQYLIPLIVFAFLCTSGPIKLYKKLPDWARLVICLGIAILSVSMLISGSYNPFLYFRF